MGLAQMIRNIFTQVSQQLPLAATADVIDDHFHNYEDVFGLAAVPNLPLHAADIERIAPFLVTSGNNAFGAAVQILGTTDTPVRTGSTYFDIRRVSIQACSNANPYIFRFIWGTPAQTSAQAITAMQYTETILQQLTANGNNKLEDTFIIRVATGSQVWGQVKNATNLATISIMYQLHEYPSPTP